MAVPGIDWGKGGWAVRLTIALVLCACLLAATARSETTNAAPSKPGGQDVSCVEGFFIMACAAIAGWVILKVYGKCPRQNDFVDVYIDKSNDGRATWTCVATNLHIQLMGQDPIEVYREQLKDTLALYKARVRKSIQQ